MEQFKRAQVIKLPTENKVNALKGYNDNSLIFKHTANYKTIDAEEGFTKFFHLYVVIEEEIKDGWFYNPHSGHIHKIGTHSDLVYINRNKCLKVIASTDTQLTNIIHDDTVPYPKGSQVSLPQPSQQFIDKYIENYNIGNIITDILVEYEIDKVTMACTCTDNIVSTNCVNSYIDSDYHESCRKRFPNGEYWDKTFKPKVNPKDNTITIKKLKDNWDRKELDVLFESYRECAWIYGNTKQVLENWKNKNL